jgi:pilus assembly protein CpaD
MSRGWMFRLTLPLLLAACVPGVAEYTKTEAPAGLQVYGGQHVLTIGFVRGSARLSPSQARHLAQLVHDGDIRPADRVEIAAAGGDGLAKARVEAIAGALLRYGIVADARPLDGVPANQAVVLVGRYAASLPPCPNWSKSPSTDFTNEPTSNYGCANAVNLGMMVANPADLAAGRTLGAANGRTEVTAVDRYLLDQVIPPVVTQVGSITTATPTTTTAAPAGVP